MDFLTGYRQDEARIEELTSALRQAEEAKWERLERELLNRTQVSVAADLGLHHTRIGQMLKTLNRRRTQQAN